jgi:hypothetical protein
MQTMCITCALVRYEQPAINQSCGKASYTPSSCLFCTMKVLASLHCNEQTPHVTYNTHPI